MSEADRGERVMDAFDETRSASMIRKSVSEAVEGALANAAGDSGTRRDIRAAGERLGNALVAYAGATEPVPQRRASTLSAGAPAADDWEGRARAFRTMAGVRR